MYSTKRRWRVGYRRRLERQRRREVNPMQTQQRGWVSASRPYMRGGCGEQAHSGLVGFLCFSWCFIAFALLFRLYSNWTKHPCIYDTYKIYNIYIHIYICIYVCVKMYVYRCKQLYTAMSRYSAIHSYTALYNGLWRYVAVLWYAPHNAICATAP